MRRREEHGETLVETLVSTALLGIVGIGIIGAIASVLISTDVDRKISRGETVLRSYVAAIQDEAYRPSGSGYGDSYPDPHGFHVNVASVSCWNDTNLPAAVPAATVSLHFGACPGRDPGMQQITVTVKGTDSRSTTESATFVKRSQATPPASGP